MNYKSIYFSKQNISFLFVILFSICSSAQELTSKKVEIEWDPIVGAKSYEVEISPQNGSPTIQRVTGNIVKLQIPLGVYNFRVRALDSRGTRTEWSEPENLNTLIQRVQKLSPKEEASFQSTTEATEAIDFKWQDQPGVESYEFSIVSGDQLVKETEIVNGSSLRKNLPVGKIYMWTVKVAGTLAPPDQQPRNLTILGKALDKPEIQAPANSFVRDLEWKAPKYAESYKFLLQRFNRKTNKWDNVLSQEQHKENSIEFDGRLPGGAYRLLVSARGSLRGNSPTANISFNVKNGDRSPAAEETFEIRQSIDRISGWFSSLSYLMTMFDYKSTNYDRANSSLSYSAIGATGRIGFGFLKSPANWGFHGILDISGIKVDNKTTTFASTEANAVHRQTWGRFGEIRNNLGFYYKELPETVGFASTQSTSTELIKILGPHYGFEYWRALDSQFGLQTNAHIYLPLMKMKTPNDQAIVMTPSYQLGLLGSYRWQPNLTALLGYAYRIDQIKYKALPGAVNGDTNNLSIAGHYLNFYLEWDM